MRIADMPSKPRTLRPAARQGGERYDRQRGSAAARGYGREWQAARAVHLAQHPLCAYCELRGDVTPATLVDHLYPHRRFDGVFWVREWWVSSCAPCHDGFKQRIERSGKRGLDELAAKLGRPVLRGGGGQKV